MIQHFIKLSVLGLGLMSLPSLAQESTLNDGTESNSIPVVMDNEGPIARPALENGSLQVKWNAGSPNCLRNTDPAIQIHAYNDNLIIMRQNKCVNYEAPFMYLIFGEEKALLIDTGATRSASEFPLQQTVEQLLVQRYGVQGRSAIQLVVAHSHAHGDHVAGDGQFRGQAQTTVVGTSVAAVTRFFGLSNWPTQEADYDLGGRILQIIPLPGHEDSHIAVFDKQTGILFTGDTLYPGRLYIDEWSTYRSSVARLTYFMQDKTVTHVLGAHIELSDKPGVDYPIGTTYHSQEHGLPLSFETLLQLNSRLTALGPNPTYDVQKDFIIYP